MEYDSIYVYGILDGKINQIINSPGIGGREDKVFGVHFKDVTAVISNTPFIEYDPTEENTLAHEKVIQEIIKEGITLAPMRFCTVLKSRADLLRLLYSAYLPFKKNILKVRNRLEFSVKVFLDTEKLKKEVGEGLIEKAREIATELHELLKSIADDLVLDEQIIENIIMNASFLVHRDNFEKFYGAINDFDKKHTEKLKIRISGPTAPYNFVKMPTKA